MAKMTVEDTSLTAVADAIRTKGGTTDQLVFPEGFVDAVGNIQTGGVNYLPQVISGDVVDITAEMLQGCTKIADIFRNYQSLKTVEIPEGVTEVGDQAFMDCRGVTRITLPNGLVRIGEQAFYSNINRESIQIPDTVRYIGARAFYNNTKNGNVTIPEGITDILEGTFQYNYSRMRLDTPSTLVTIGKNAFMGCSAMAAATFNEGLTTIGESAFSTTRINEFTIPSTVTNIGANAFSKNPLMTSFEIKAVTPPTADETPFSECPKLTTIIVPKGSLEAYKTATNWSAYADLMVEASE